MKIRFALAALLLVLGASSALAQQFNTTTGRQYQQPCPATAGCTGGTPSTPPSTPLPIKALTIQYANEGTTGTTLNKIVKIVNDPPVAIILPTSDQVNAFGIVSAGAGTTGNANVDVLGESNCVFDGATAALDYVVSSTTTAGDCHDSGSSSTFPTGVVVLGKVLSTHGGAGTYTLNLFTPDVSAATSGPNGKGNTVQVNGANSKVTANLNGTTPAAPGGNTNVTFQVSNSGNTSSISGYVPTSSVPSSANGATVYAGPALTPGSNATLVQTCPGYNNAGTVAVATCGQAITPGDQLVILEVGYSVLTLSDGPSDTFVTDLAATVANTNVASGYYAASHVLSAVGGNTTVTLTTNTTILLYLIVLEYQGITSFDAVANSICGGGNGGVCTQAVTTTAASDLLVAFSTQHGGDSIVKNSSNYTVENYLTAPPLTSLNTGMAMDAGAAGAGVYSTTTTANFSGSPGGHNSIVILAFKTSGSPSGTPAFRALRSSDLPTTVNYLYNMDILADTSAVSDTTMFTVGTSTADFRFTGTLGCTTSSAAATATLNLKWTDTSGTAQTINSVAACTSLGSSSVASMIQAIRAKNGTAITFGVTIANTPTYDVAVRLEQM